jgi:hypothetical protein
MTTFTCPKCRHEISANSGVCAFCGYRPMRTFFVKDLGSSTRFFLILVGGGMALAAIGLLLKMPAALIIGGVGLAAFGVVLLIRHTLF